MKHWTGLIIIMILGIVNIQAEGEEKKSSLLAEFEADDGGATVITCDGPMEVDYGNNIIELKDNVIVRDPKMDMRADYMRVFFAADTRSINKVIAEGRVRFKKDDKQAKSKHAVYNGSDGSVVLTGHPMVKRGMDILKGEKITFFRNDERMLCEPSAQLVFYDSKVEQNTDQDWFWKIDDNLKQQVNDQVDQVDMEQVKSLGNEALDNANISQNDMGVLLDRAQEASELSVTTTKENSFTNV